MCGIAGIIGTADEASLSSMLAAIEHRGRDDEGIYCASIGDDGYRRVLLGHRRLSIIDTSNGGHQPFHTDDGRFVITFNGEIYNYRELRRKLESQGERFRTDSDTEVLIRLFARYGLDSLQSLNGMFAFAVWDNRERSMTLVRDRSGLKPLHYAQVDGNFIFGSEIKALLAYPQFKPELDLEGFSQFLTFLWPVPPKTLFKGISQLMPGHYLIWKNGEFRIGEWWDLDFSNEQDIGNERKWIDETFEVLKRVTHMEMVADVPLGAFLSGGVDSSGIVACMSEDAGTKITAYTTGISADDLQYDIVPDDIRWARAVAKQFRIDYHETILKPDVADLLPVLIYHQDAPVIDMAIPSYLISKQARETQKVMLSGMGGDEVFGGYPRHMAMKIASFTDIIPSVVRRPALRLISSIFPGGLRGPLTGPLRNAKKFAKSAAEPFEERYLGFGTYFTAEMKRRVLVRDIFEAVDHFDVYSQHRRYFAKAREWSPLNRLLYVDFKTFLPALNLDTTDRTSMAANLEVRAPYLNPEMLEFTSRMPSSLKIKGLRRKYALKKALESILPRDVVWRKKAGFSAPIRAWLRGPLRPMISDLLSPTAIRNRGIFNERYVRDMIAANDSGREDFNLQLFQLLNWELFSRQYFDK